MSNNGKAVADLPAGVPRLSDQVLIGPREYIAGKAMRLAKHAGSGKYYRMGEKEVFLLHHLDGQHSTDQILEKYRENFGRTVTEESWQKALRLFAQRGLTDGNGSPGSIQEVEPDEHASHSVQPGPFSQKLWACNPDELIATLAQYCRWFINGPFFALWSLFILASELLVFPHRHALWSTFVGHSPQTVIIRALVFFAIISITTTAHEFAHAIACKRYGGEVREMGFLFRYFAFCAYTRIDDILLLPRRIERAYVLLIGPLVSLSLIPFALAGWLWLPQSATMHMVAADILIWYNVGCLIQLIPFLQFDGYFILAQMLRMPDLRKDSYNYLLNWTIARLRGRPSTPAFPDVDAHLVVTYVVYGVLSLLVSAVGIGFILGQYGRSLFQLLGLIPSIIVLTFLLGIALWRLYSVTLPWVKNSYANTRPREMIAENTPQSSH